MGYSLVRDSAGLGLRLFSRRFYVNAEDVELLFDFFVWKTAVIRLRFEIPIPSESPDTTELLSLESGADRRQLGLSPKYKWQRDLSPSAICRTT